MPAKFDFLSPGVLLREIDKSQLPVEVEADGPLIIGRARSGPANKPVRVKNLDDFVSVFGEPVSGKGSVDCDVWREGNLQGATMGMYAAQAWLAAETGPLTYVRLLGEEHPSRNETGAAGWDLTDMTAEDGGGAYGLFMVPSGAVSTNHTGTLAAVFYASGATSVKLSGTAEGGGGAVAANAATMASIAVDGAPGFTVRIESTDYTFNFNPSSDKFIRKVFNTNPQRLNQTNFSNTKDHFLGESYEEAVEQYITGLAGGVADAAGESYGIMLPLLSGTVGQHANRRPMSAPATGWFISKDTGAASDYNPENMEKLFKPVSGNNTKIPSKIAKD